MTIDLPMKLAEDESIRDSRIQFATRVLLRNLMGLEECSGSELARRQKVVRKALETSPELDTLIRTFILVFQPTERKRAKMRRRVENAKVEKPARKKIAKASPTPPIQVTEKIIRLPAFNGRETPALKAARRALIARAHSDRPTPPQAS